MPLPDSARRVIGGRWALSWVAFALIAAPVVMVWVIQSAVGGSITASRAMGVLAGVLLGAGLLLLADRTAFRGRRVQPVPVWWVAALGGVLWGAEAVLRIAVGEAGGGTGTSGVQAVVSVVAIAMGGAVVWPLLALLLGTYDAFVRERRSLVEAAVRLEGQMLRESGSVAALRSVLHEAESDAVWTALRSTRAALDDVVRSGDDRAAGDASHMLRAVASDVVRPASHRLWEAGTRDDRTRVAAGPAALIARALRAHPLPLLPVLGVYSVLVLLFTLARPGTAGDRLVVVGASVAIIALLYPAGTGVVHRVPQRHRVVVAGCTIALSGVMVAIASALLGPGGVQVLPVLNGVVAATVGLAVPLALSAFDAQRATLDDLRDQVDAAQVRLAALRRTEASLEREFAAHLHETVQARMIAASYAVDDARRAADPALLRKAVATARDALDIPVDQPPSVAPGDLPALRRTVDAQWQGILDLTWSLDGAHLAPHDIRVVHQLLDQALVNAMVHGAAATVRIGLHGGDGPGTLTLCVRDDGRGPRGGAPAGGTRALDMATHGCWTLLPGEHGGAVLSATIPVGRA